MVIELSIVWKCMHSIALALYCLMVKDAASECMAGLTRPHHNKRTSIYNKSHSGILSVIYHCFMRSTISSNLLQIRCKVIEIIFSGFPSSHRELITFFSASQLQFKLRLDTRRTWAEVTHKSLENRAEKETNAVRIVSRMPPYLVLLNVIYLLPTAWLCAESSAWKPYRQAMLPRWFWYPWLHCLESVLPASNNRWGFRLLLLQLFCFVTALLLVAVINWKACDCVTVHA